MQSPSVALIQLTPGDKQPIIHLTKLMVHADDAVQCGAIKELAKLGSKIIPILENGIKDMPQPLYKINICNTFTTMVIENTATFETVLPHLIRFNTDSKQEVRDHAACCVEILRNLKKSPELE